MAGATIQFHLTSVDAESRFVDYLADAWERFDAADYWEHGWFWRYGQVSGYESGPPGGLVKLVFDGDPDALVDAERERWDAIDGLERWDLLRYDDPDDVGETYPSLLAQQRDAKGAVGGEREYRFKAICARFALELHREFGDDLPTTPDPDPPEDPIGIGAWALLHDLLVQLGYDWYDETDVALRMLANRLRSIAAYRGGDAAREEYERVRERWAAEEADLEEWLAEHPTGEQSEP